MIKQKLCLNKFVSPPLNTHFLYWPTFLLPGPGEISTYSQPTLFLPGPGGTLTCPGLHIFFLALVGLPTCPGLHFFFLALVGLPTCPGLHFFFLALVGLCHVPAYTSSYSSWWNFKKSWHWGKQQVLAKLFLFLLCPGMLDLFVSVVFTSCGWWCSEWVSEPPPDTILLRCYCTVLYCNMLYCTVQKVKKTKRQKYRKTKRQKNKVKKAKRQKYKMTKRQKGKTAKRQKGKKAKRQKRDNK